MNKAYKLLFVLAGLILSAQNTHAVFSDVASNHEYYDAISYLEDNDIVQGYEDGSYRPDQRVNRAEALKIILLGSDILVPEIADQDIFPDVLHGTWYAKYTAKAKNLSIVKGDDGTGMFRPGDTVNLAEILKILLETNKIELRTKDDMERRPYADVPTDAWFAPYFDYADSIGLLYEDEDYNVFPSTEVTRGLMAHLIYQLALKPQGYQEGTASYYGEKFHGKTTANGEVFDASGFTAAHRKFPFDTWLKVTNLENGEWVHVRVNDRGPYADVENRIIDLSKAAFESISPLSRGIINVSITPLNGEPSERSSDEEDESEEALVETSEPEVLECPELDDIGYVSKSFYENISLDEEFPDTILESQVLTLKGHSASSNKLVSAFLANVDTGDQYPFYTDVDNQGDFEVNVFFPAPGEYQLGVIPGDAGSSVVHKITVVENNCLAESIGALTEDLNLRLSVKEGDTVIRWNYPDGYNLAKLSFSQSGKEQVYFVSELNEISPNYTDFEGWNEASVSIQIQVGKLNEDSLGEMESLSLSPKTGASFKAHTHYEYNVIEDNISLLNVPNTLAVNDSFTLRVNPKTNIQEYGKVILPSGFVEDVLLESPSSSPVSGSTGESVYTGTTAELRFTYTPKTNGVHFIEINDEESLAALNIPIYPKNTYPLLPNQVELSFNDDYELNTNMSALRNQMLNMVNADRKAHGLAAISLDLTLSQLAQHRSDDMVENNYFSHWDTEGYTANDIRSDFAITQYVSENIARDTNPELAEYGLMRSAAHRANILKEEWKRVGFGITEDSENGGIIFVQIFSDDPINFADLNTLRADILEALNEERSSNFNLSNQLNSLSQTWSERMSSEDFFDFTAPDGTGFVDNARDAGITATLGTYIVGNSSFESAILQLTENEQLKEPRWINLGIGIKQDSYGIIKITLIYTE